MLEVPMNIAKSKFLLILGCLFAAESVHGLNNVQKPREETDEMVKMGLLYNRHDHPNSEKSVLERLKEIGLATESPTGNVQLAGCSNTTTHCGGKGQ
jgi:hypothetical protein